VTISENATSFFDHPIRDFAGSDDWGGPSLAYRLRTTWEDESNVLIKRLEKLAEQRDAGKLEALVIGSWQGSESDQSSEEIVKGLVVQQAKLAGLRALFLGDITYEENEISWIEQSDVSPLLKAYRQLELFRVRGGNRLVFSRVRHEKLAGLIIETGGMPRSLIREVCRCEFPNLQHLELWLGVENYGWDGGVEDLQPILTGTLFPKLQYLGLRNSDIVDDIIPVIVNAPILRQLNTLDLSNGTLSDVGAQAFLQLPQDIPLKELNLSHHYMTEEMVKKLRKNLKCQVVADDPQNPDEEWRGVLVSE